MTRGGTRPNAGRPKLPDAIRKHKVNFWITLAEKEMIRRFINRIREATKNDCENNIKHQFCVGINAQFEE